MEQQPCKISYLIPGIGFSDQEVQRRQRILQQYGYPHVDIDVSTVDDGPRSIESFYDAAFAGPTLLRKLRALEQMGYNAVILGGYFDPFLDAARECTSIPIIGPGETSMLFAVSLCRQFSIVTMLQTAIPILRQQIKTLGFEAKLASIRSIQTPVQTVNQNKEQAQRALLQEYIHARDDDGAEAVIPGNMSLAFLQQHREHTQQVGIPVLDPVSLSVKMAELLIALELTPSKCAYPSPRHIY
jgi:allantoin racemase